MQPNSALGWDASTHITDLSGMNVQFKQDDERVWLSRLSGNTLREKHRHSSASYKFTLLALTIYKPPKLAADLVAD